MLLRVIVKNNDSREELKTSDKLPPVQMNTYLVTSSPDQKQLFWSLELNSKTINLKSGFEGEEAESQSKHFVSELVARYEAYKYIIGKRDEGYHLPSRINMEALKEYKPIPVDKLGEDIYFNNLDGNYSNFIVIEGDLYIDELDMDALHGKTDGLIITGDLYVDGGIYNTVGDYGPALVVEGDVQADYLFGGGSEIRLNGKTYIHSYVIGHYNHGSLWATKSVAVVMISCDHNLSFNADYEYQCYGGEERKKGFPSFKEVLGDEFNGLIDNGYIDHHKFMALAFEDKQKSLKLLKNIIDANKAGEPELLKVMQDGFAIKDIKNPTKEIQLGAVTQDGMALQYIKNPSEEVKIAAVSSNAHALELIKNPSEEIQIAAVENIRYGAIALQYIKNPSKDVITQAVETDSDAIEYVKNPSEEIQLLAVSKGTYNNSIEYIKNPSEKVQLAAVKQYGGAISHIKNPSDKVQLEAVNQSGIHIEDIKNPSEEIKLAAVKEHGAAIQQLKNPSEEIKLAAVMQDGSSIEFIDNPSEEIIIAAVKQSSYVIETLQDPSQQVQMAAVLANLSNFEDIKKATQKVKMTYKRLKSCESLISESEGDDSEKRYTLLRKVLDECPEYHDAYLQYAKFLTYTRKEYDEAEKYFKKGIEVCPTCGQIFFEYGKFLYDVRKQTDSAEKNYIKAVEMRESYDDLLFKYGVFLVNVRKDYDKAKLYTRKAVEESQGVASNPFYSINYAQVVLITGHRSDADYHIGLAIESDDPGLQLEGWFYRLAHYPQYFKEAQKELDRLLAEGHRSIGWNLDGNIERAKKDGFQNTQLLKDYAKKITTK